MSRKKEPPPADDEPESVDSTDTTGSFSVRTLSGPLGVALLCGGVLMAVHLLTADRISHNELQQSQKQLRMLLDDAVAVEFLDKASWNTETQTLCLPDITIVRRQASGYGGVIELLFAIRQKQSPELSAALVTRHLETPGIADFLNNTGPQGWLARLRNQSASSLVQLDTVTGATISSKAILQAAVRALQETAENTGCAP